MRRREFLGALGVAAWPLAARAQQARLPTIGFLGSGTPVSQGSWVTAFVQRLRESGWIEGRTIAIEYRWAEGRAERFAEIAAEFVRLKVDVIFAVGTEATLAAKRATAVIPIVFPLGGDPVGTGLIASLARPGGNVTGLSNQASDLAAKRLEILREIVPGLRRLAVMANADYSGPALPITAGGIEDREVLANRKLQDALHMSKVRLSTQAIKTEPPMSQMGLGRVKTAPDTTLRPGIVFDQERNVYVCPGGAEVTSMGAKPSDLPVDLQLVGEQIDTCEIAARVFTQPGSN
jgi:hypothetical protein